MKQFSTFLIAFMCLLTTGAAFAQGPQVSSWIRNTDGRFASFWQNTGTQMNPSFTFNNTSDSADVLQVCYDVDHVYVRSHGMTVGMGQFTNPGTPSAQDYTWKFPRDTAEAVNKTETSVVGAIGVLTNGIPIFGKGDARSWDNNTQGNEAMGQGIWNGEAMYGEGQSLDTAFGAHPQMQGAYHTHGTPFRLYDFPSSTHSPIVGFAFDGYPIYGPYGYTNPGNPSAGVSRLTPSHRLRSMTQRHTLPDGTTLQPNEYGPDVSNQHPLGEYIEDYEFVQGLGDLDQHNGRWGITPEYPNGTYAYFTTATANNEPVFPYFIGETYFGEVETDNIGPMNNITIPAGVNCGLTGIEEQLQAELTVYPNPSSHNFVLEAGLMQVDVIRVTDMMGAEVLRIDVPVGGRIELSTDNWESGMYYCTVILDDAAVTKKLVLVH